ncbi:MAG: PLxRFG domain-containing protein [Chloroflexi bacterium]|nr:PLxRFG domain-containing protein [Chloroflexota bacterium]MBT7538647.1 PLxRFG domain-containing protein [Gammaproteobacteria bacterium]
MPVNSLQDVRDQYPEFSDQSDEDLLNSYADDVGVNRDVVRAGLMGGTRREAVAPEPENTRGDFQRGIRTYGNQIVGLGAGVGALVADSVGATDTRDALFETYQERMEAMQAHQRPAFELEHLQSDEATGGDYVDAAQYYTTLGLSNLAGGGLAGFAGKQLAKGGLKKLAEHATKDQIKKAAKRGFAGGLGVNAIGQGLGSTYGQAGEEQIARGNTLDEVDNVKAAFYGTAAGSLEFASDLFLLGAGRFLPQGAAGKLGDALTSGGVVKRGLKGFGAAAAVEGATESGQTMLEDLGSDVEVQAFDDDLQEQQDYRNKLWQAAFAGAAAGGLAGGVVGGLRPQREPDLGGTDITGDGEGNSPPPTTPDVEFTPDSAANQRVILGRLEAVGVDAELNILDGQTPGEAIDQSTPKRPTKEQSKQREADVKAAYDAPSEPAIYANDKETQIERRLSEGEVMELRAIWAHNENQPEKFLPIPYEGNPYVKLSDSNGNTSTQELDPSTGAYRDFVGAVASRIERRAGRGKATQVENLVDEPDSITPPDTQEKADQATRDALAKKTNEPKRTRKQQRRDLVSDPIFQTAAGREALVKASTKDGSPNADLQRMLLRYREVPLSKLRETLTNAKTSEWKKALVREVIVERGENPVAPVVVAAPAAQQTTETVAEPVKATDAELMDVLEVGQQDMGLTDGEQTVWNLLLDAAVNDEMESIVSLSKKNSKSNVSPKAIADRTGMKRNTVSNYLKGIRGKVEASMGVDMYDALGQINTRRREMNAEQAAQEDVVDEAELVGGVADEQALANQDEEVEAVAQEELAEGAGFTIRDETKGVSGISAFDVTDATRVDALLENEAVAEMVKTEFETQTGKKWAAQSKSQKRQWFGKFQQEQDARESDEAIRAENARLQEESAANHVELLEAFRNDETLSMGETIYDRTAQNEPEGVAQTPFAELTPGYQQTVIEMLATGEQSARGLVNSAQRALQEIQNDRAREQRSEASARLSRDDSQQAAQEQPGETGLGDTTVSENQTQQQAIEGLAEKLAADGKITTKKSRRVIPTEKGDMYAYEGTSKGKKTGVTAQAAKRVASRIASARGWRANGSWKLEVVETFSDLPAHIQAEFQALGGATLFGVMNTRTTFKTGNEPFFTAYIVSDSHSSLADIEDTVLHEMTHVAAASMFGADRTGAMASVSLGMGRDKLFALADKLGVSDALLHYEKEFLDSDMGLLRARAVLFEEMMAYSMGRKTNAGLWNDIKAAVGEFKQWLRRHGFHKLAGKEVGETETLALMRRLNKELMGQYAAHEFQTTEAGDQATVNVYENESRSGQTLNPIVAMGREDLIGKIADGTATEEYIDDLIQVLDDAVKSGRYTTEFNDKGQVVFKPVSDWEGVLPISMAKFGESNSERVSTEMSAISDKIAWKVEETLPGVFTAYEKGKLGWLTLEQIADRSGFPQVRNYVDAVHKIQRTSKDLLADAHSVNKVWSAIQSDRPKQIEAMNALMIDTTLEQYDPSKDAPQTPEQQKLKRNFDKLDGDVKTLYETVRDEFTHWHNDKVAILEGAILDAAAADNPQNLDKLTGDLESMKKIKGPYFPLKRLNKYYTVGMSSELEALMNANDEAPLVGKDKALMAQLRKDPNHYIAESFKTVNEARERQRQLEKRMGASYYQESTDLYKAQIRDAPDIAAIEKYFASSDLTPDAKGKVRGILEYMYADMLPGNAAAKSQLKREGVHGADKDMRQVFSDSAVKNAHMISRMKHSKEVGEALLDIRGMGSRQNEGEATRVRNEINNRAGMVYEHDESPIADSFMTLSFMAHLGLSPAYIATNMSQVPMITAPWLAARHGVRSATSAIGKAYADTGKIIKSNWVKEGGFRNGGWRMEFDWEGKLPANESRMMQELLERNKLDITIEHDLSAVAKGGSDSGIASQFSRNSEYIQILNTPVRISELANRAVTALASYRLESKRLKGDSTLSAEQVHAQATEYALQGVNETQLDYSGLNAPRYMQEVAGSRALGKIVFQFRKYQQGMVYLITKNMKDAMFNSNATKQEQREARNTLFGLFTTTGIMGGMTGMPLAGSIAWLANLATEVFGDDDDEPFDAELALREFWSEFGGGGEDGADFARAMMHGLPTIGGLDVSRRIGMGDLLFALPFRREGETPRETVAETIIAALGAAPAYGVNAYDGVNTMVDAASTGEGGRFMKGLEKIVPAKGVQNLFKGYNLSDQGLTERSGEPIIGPEGFDSADVLMQYMGFAPTKVSDYYTANMRRSKVKQAVEGVRGDLLRRYAQAKLVGDRSTVQAVRKEIQAFNLRNNQRKGVRITPKTMRRSLQNRRDSRRDRGAGGLRGGKQYDRYNDEVDFITGEQQ